MSFFKDFSLSAATAGFVAVLVGFTSSVAIVFSAALAFKATPEQLTSWMWALGLGMGLCTLIPSLILRKPVMVAWSTPGAAVLAVAGVAGASGAGYSMNEAVGAFMICAALITLAGVTGWFEKLMDRIPMAIAAALLAGVLARFGMQGFVAAQTDWALVVLMLITYLLGKRWNARYAVVLTLVIAIIFVAFRADSMPANITFSLAKPVFVMPEFSWGAAISLALPLFIVTMASQNLPGVAAIRASGFQLPLSKIISMTGVATFLLAPFGGFALNLSAITAAICMGKEAHPDPDKRYIASSVCGIIYIFIGLFASIVTALLTAFPKELIAAIAGLALLGTIAGGLATALQDEKHRDAAIITFLVTLSGVTLAGIGAAFWGVVAGSLALFVQNYRAKT
ncbi:benzoate/H(+) symporter BenE family transporter [Variovorax sp. PCZ-1]|uniref:benzoate/H(+) symporter BenE family transporter n=1 Tax=Variovorax sp. PCZ-1 TaxID=2835533 RepID=UPI001BCF25A0|nr:benzoate/H(+) symporter BenE family transporter [Variovorax sp. PCZ-1]MBS7808918.1 benzoate/H(+) symporter BenE family transporter [Variovorax sp. PCZ-1]